LRLLFFKLRIQIVLLSGMTFSGGSRFLESAQQALGNEGFWKNPFGLGQLFERLSLVLFDGRKDLEFFKFVKVSLMFD